MRLKNEIVEKIRSTRDLKLELMYRMRWSEAKLYKALRDNAEDSDLTKISSLKIISAGLGVSEEQILEAEALSV